MPDVERVDLHLQDGEDRTCVFEADHLQVMRVRLAVGEALPTHSTNSNVVFVPLSGSLQVVTGELTSVLTLGEALSVPEGTEITVSSVGSEPVALLVLKAPHPRTLA